MTIGDDLFGRIHARRDGEAFHGSVRGCGGDGDVGERPRSLRHAGERVRLEAGECVRRRGFAEQVIQTILVDNPRRVLAMPFTL